jgi:hypothetical protein
MTVTTQTSELFTQMTGKALDALTLWADANQKILRELVDLSAGTAKEGVRLYAELQSAAVESLKEGQAYVARRQADLQDLPTDPFSCYQKSMLESVETAQRAFRVLEGNAQAITRSAERLQGTAEQANREIQATFAGLAGKVKDLWVPLR